MAFYDPSRNKNFKASASKEPAYDGAANHPVHMKRSMMFYKDGGQHAIVGHFAAHNSQSYVVETREEVVEFGSGDDHKYSPAKKEVFMDHGAGGLSPYTARSSTKKDERLSPKIHRPPGVYNGSPVKDTFLKDKSSPPRNHQYYNTNNYGKYSHLSSNHDKNDEDDDPSHNYKMNAKPKEYEENNKRSGYAPPDNYTAPYHFKESYNNNNEKHNGNNNGYVHSKVKIIPQIKTRIGDPEFAKANMKAQMGFASPKRGQGYPEVIDSSEARRRYGGMPSARAGQYIEDMYEDKIDCREAARKYNGVFVPK